MVHRSDTPPQLARRVGVRIRAARTASGLGTERVAGSAGLTRRELSSYESGRVLPSRSDLFALACACGMSLDELIPPGLLEMLP